MVQLQRIACVLGLPAPRPERPSAHRTPQDALREAAAAGIAVQEGRPDDPLLDFLDI